MLFRNGDSGFVTDQQRRGKQQYLQDYDGRNLGFKITEDTMNVEHILIMVITIHTRKILMSSYFRYRGKG